MDDVGIAPASDSIGAPGAPLRILIVSDAWFPQVNGVVRTMSIVADQLRAGGDTVEVIGPDRFVNIPMPGYAEIRLAIAPGRRLRRLVEAFAPDVVHIATEGPLGWAMRALCRKRGWPFTTAFHTRFPDYLHARTRIPVAWSWAVMRRFHNAGAGTFAATRVAARGAGRRAASPRCAPGRAGWTWRGSGPSRATRGTGWRGRSSCMPGAWRSRRGSRPSSSLDLPGTKVVVGDGPARAGLMQRFPGVHFTGYRDNGALARSYAGADVFVFPSRTDTFGLVLLEALACGHAGRGLSGDRAARRHHAIRASARWTRICARPACAPCDCDRTACRTHAEHWSWEACAAQFRAALVPVT